MKIKTTVNFKFTCVVIYKTFEQTFRETGVRL